MISVDSIKTSFDYKTKKHKTKLVNNIDKMLRMATLNFRTLKSEEKLIKSEMELDYAFNKKKKKDISFRFNKNFRRIGERILNSKNMLLHSSDSINGQVDFLIHKDFSNYTIHHLRRTRLILVKLKNYFFIFFYYYFNGG